MSDVKLSTLEESDETAFTVQAVISQSWQLFTQCWPSHLGLVVVSYVPLIAFGAAWPLQERLADQWGKDAPTLVGYSLFLLGLGIGSSIRIHMTGSQLRGERPSALQSAKALLPRLAIIFALWFVRVFTGFASFLFLVIPGILFNTYFFVVTPAQILENLGPVASFRRSVALTGKQRYEILGFIVTCVFTTGLFFSAILFLSGIWRAVAFHRLKIAKGEMIVRPSTAKEG